MDAVVNARRVVSIDIYELIKRRKAGRRKRSKYKKNRNNNVDLPVVADEINSESIPLESFQKRSPNLSKLDVCMVTQQLGYYPYNIVEVAAYSPLMNPLVVQLYPLNGNLLGGRYGVESSEKKMLALPFPTMLWMCCPYLHAKISHLEDLGFITVFQQRLNEDAIEMQSMHSAHNSYGEERWSLLSTEDKLFVEENNWIGSLRDVGVAGIRDFNTVKCLHCHLAHHLARPEHGNRVGAWTEQLLLEMHNTATSIPSEIAEAAPLSQSQGNASEGGEEVEVEAKSESESESECLVEEAFARLQLNHEPESREDDGHSY